MEPMLANQLFTSSRLVYQECISSGGQFLPWLVIYPLEAGCKPSPVADSSTLTMDQDSTSMTCGVLPLFSSEAHAYHTVYAPSEQHVDRENLPSP
jgi:hypothetical protein